MKLLKELISQFEIWIVNLDTRKGTEPDKTRPVVIIQINLLNKLPHPSTIICPVSTNIEKESNILRVNIKKGEANMKFDCDILIDQIRAIDNKRLISKIGSLSTPLIQKIKENISIVLDL